MTELEVLFGLLAVTTLLVGVARRVGIAYPIFLTIAGLALSLIPGLPHIELEPEIIFLLFLPPILTSAGFFTPLRDFRANIRAIMLLSLGLVVFTTAIVALVAKLLLPELPWAVCFTLGAIVAPPDAIAATAVAKRLNLPKQLVTIIEGESLVNDASALVAYRVAVAAALTGVFSLADAGASFVISSGGGVLVGLAIGLVMEQLLTRLDDTPVELLLTFIASFGAYAIAERLHVSGVLATVVLGLYVGRISARVMSSETRVQALPVWEIVVFLLNGLAFILIGLQLPTIVGEVGGGWQRLLGPAAAICAAVIVARMVWVFPGAYLPRVLSRRIRQRTAAPQWQGVAVLGWAGMRGIVSLAAALALPKEFPSRDIVIFLTFVVILATLVGQGLTLPAVIRRLGVRDDGEHEREEDRARLVTAHAGLARLDELMGEEWAVAAHVADLRGHYEARLQRFEARMLGQEQHAAAHDDSALAMQRLRRELIDAELTALLELRDTGTINDEVLRTVQRELDFERVKLEV